MCGIIGYLGERQAQSILLTGLKALEYRGYDSCGITVIGDDHLEVYKDALRVESLVKASPQLLGVMGIGHTRWATHGPPCRANAHPHQDCTGKVAIVHNGIISNYVTLRKWLTSEGHTFTSETDSEVVAHLIEKFYSGDLEKAMEAALQHIEGSYAIIAVVAGDPKMVVARKDSPLVIGIGDRETFVASDVPAILGYTDRVMYLEDGDLGVITRQGVRIKSRGVEVIREEHKITWNVEEAQKAGYEHFMLKEIHEQPRVIRNTLGQLLRSSEEEEQRRILWGAEGKLPDTVLMLACGTSYHAAMVGKYIIQEIMAVPARVEIASEFNYYSHTLARTVAIAITQSGETADTLRAIKRLKEEGCHVIAITNVLGSTASRIASETIYTSAGPEISVAATKSFTAQLMVLYWLAASNSNPDTTHLSKLYAGLRQLPNAVQQVLSIENQIAEYARRLAGYESAFFIGRGINYPIALEGALKLKEISYIHAEGYAAGETKHGPFSLLGPRTPVVAVVARDNTHDAMLTNIKEMKARGSPIIAVAEQGDGDMEGLADYVIPVPEVDTILSPVVNIAALQLLSYHAALERGCPIDFPRNLAKSVTVE